MSKTIETTEHVTDGEIPKSAEKIIHGEEYQEAGVLEQWRLIREDDKAADIIDASAKNRGVTGKLRQHYVEDQQGTIPATDHEA